MRLKDVLLIVVAFAGIAGGVFLPGPSGLITPATLYMMMVILYLSFLGLDFSELTRLSSAECVELSIWSVLKLGVLPLALWALFNWLAPLWALPVLLLSGVSAGVTAPFFAMVLGARPERTLKLVVLTSMLVPFTLPGLVKLLMGAELGIPLSHLVRTLALVIFIPLVLAYLSRRLIPRLPAAMAKIQFPLILTLFFLINLGVFAPYAAFLKSNTSQVISAVGVAFAAGALYFITLWVMGPLSGGRMDRLSYGMGMVFINNVLIIVVSAEFFGPECPMLAAAYMLPIFMMLLPLRLIPPKP